MSNQTIIDIHPDWHDHPIVARSFDRTNDLLGALQGILDATDELERRLPGAGMATLGSPDRDRAELAATLRDRGVEEDVISEFVGETVTVRTYGRTRSNVDGLTDAERVRFEVGDMRVAPSELRALNHPAAMTFGQAALDSMCALWRPLTAKHRQVLALRQAGYGLQEIVDELGVAMATVSSALERDRYHRSRELHDHEVAEVNQ